MGLVVKAFKWISSFIIIVLLGWAFFAGYPYIFSKKVQGVVTGVEKVQMPMAIVSEPRVQANTQIFSFAVAIKDEKTKEFFTSSSEDRQWAVVQKGQCAVAEFFPYPPWKIDKWGTYYNARLLKLFECPVN